MGNSSEVLETIFWTEDMVTTSSLSKKAPTLVWEVLETTPLKLWLAEVLFTPELVPTPLTSTLSPLVWNLTSMVPTPSTSTVCQEVTSKSELSIFLTESTSVSADNGDSVSQTTSASSTLWPEPSPSTETSTTSLLSDFVALAALETSAISSMLLPPLLLPPLPLPPLDLPPAQAPLDLPLLLVPADKETKEEAEKEETEKADGEADAEKEE